MGNIAFSIHFQNVNRGKWWKTQIRIFHDSASVDFSNISDSCEGLCDKRKIVKSPKRGISKTELLIVIALCYSFWDMINWQGKLHKVERDGSSVNSSDYEMGKNICCMPKHWLGYRTKQNVFHRFPQPCNHNIYLSAADVLHWDLGTMCRQIFIIIISIIICHKDPHIS